MGNNIDEYIIFGLNPAAHILKCITNTIVFLLLFAQVGAAQTEIGEDAPEFTLQAYNGGKVSLADFEGQVVYIFFFGYACPDCLSNGHVTEDTYQLFKDEPGFVALGLDMWDGPESGIKHFKGQTGISYQILMMASETCGEYFGSTAAGLDRSVVIGPDGKLRYRGSSAVNRDAGKVRDVISKYLDQAATSTLTGEFSQPTGLTLHQNYPNPFNPATYISYELSVPSQVQLDVYNSLGIKVATLVDTYQTAGKYTISWDASAWQGRTLSSGIYHYRLRAGRGTQSRSMLLMK